MSSDSSDSDDSTRTVPRRWVVGSSAAGIAGLAGCGSDGGDSPTDDPLTGGQGTTTALPATPSAVPDGAVLAPDLSDAGYWELLSFTCLQGLANREAPRVFAYYDTKSTESWYDRLDVPEDRRVFYEWYEQYDFLEFADMEDPYRLFEALDPLPATGYVIVDEDAPVTANVAANYASTEDLLPATADFVDRSDTPDLDVVYDLRETHEGADFSSMDHLAVYEWIYEHQRPDASSQWAANLSTPSSTADAGPNDFFHGNRARDYTVSNRGLFFDLASSGDTEALKDRFLSAMDEQGVVLGWHQGAGEGNHIRQLSRHGLVALGAVTYAANYSFHSRLRVDGALERFREVAGRVDSAGPIEDTVYVTFVVSDGDSLNFLSRRAQGGQWLLDARGDIPVAWEMAPQLAEQAPGLLDYFAQTASENDYFVGGPSGLGYYYPEYVEDRAVLRRSLETARGYLRETGLSSLTIMGPGRPATDDTARLHHEVLGDTLTGCMEGYVRRDPDRERVLGSPSDGREQAPIDVAASTTWVPTAYPAGEESEDALAEALEAVVDRRARRPTFVPVHLPAHRLTVADAAGAVERLGDDVTVVSPDEFYTLFARARTGEVTVDAPEGFAPATKTLRPDESNDVQFNVHAFGEPSTVEVEARLTSEHFDSPLTSSQMVTVAADERVTRTVSLDVPAVPEDSAGRLAYRVGEETHVSTPVTFAPPRERWVYEAEAANHRDGRRVDDDDALNGVAWEAVAGEHGEDGKDFPNHVVWLPTTDQGQGEYVAKFRLKVAERVEDRVAQIDAVENVPGGPPSSEFDYPSSWLRGTDFTAAEEYEVFELPFEVPMTDAPIDDSQRQYRVLYAGNATLTIDRITIERRS